MSGRRSRPEVVVISWRDIPAQVNGRAGDVRHQVVLSAKFQRAIDRAKRKAGIVTAADDVAQWRRVATRCEGNVVIAADALAAELEAAWSRDELGRLAFGGGFSADVSTEAVTRSELRALEELDRSSTQRKESDDRDRRQLGDP